MTTHHNLPRYFTTLSAEGAEILAPHLSSWMYGVKPEDLTSEQKNTISAIISLGSAAVGATTGETTDVISSSVAGTTAVEENTYGTDPINKIAFGDAKEMAESADRVSKYSAFIAATSKNAYIAGFAGAVSTISTIDKHLLLIEAGKFSMPDALMDFVLEIMPMPTKLQDYLLDTTASETYDRLKDKK